MPHTQTALIIDDERDIRELLVMTLGRMGLAVDTAADIASAERQLASKRYDLCFTDMRLPRAVSGVKSGACRTTSRISSRSAA